MGTHVYYFFVLLRKKKGLFERNVRK